MQCICIQVSLAHVGKSYPKIIPYERKFKMVKFGDKKNYTYINENNKNSVFNIQY